MAALGFLAFVVVAMIFLTPSTSAFATTATHQRCHHRVSSILAAQESSSSSDSPALVDVSEKVDNAYTSLRDEAETLKAKAERLRQEIEKGESNRSPTAAENNNLPNAASVTATTSVATANLLPWSLVESDEQHEGQEFRFYVDVGREDGTWMDPRWGASGNRIPFTLDIKLLSDTLADATVAEKMVKDNSMGRSSQVFALESAPFARLRDGFDRMACHGGAYRIDKDNGGRYTIRMMIEVEGTKADQNYVYGDVYPPKKVL
ncbi:MAG: hypothetical protein SGARI_003206 [Bacillariaceae sp.]